MVGILRPNSALIGKTIGDAYQTAGDGALEIVAILRAGNVVLPTPEMTLQEDDRLLTIGSSKAQSRISEQLMPLEPPSAQRPANGHS
jgi:K+/H+ antiporter YhaU regulatory subunit KhtT